MISTFTVFFDANVFYGARLRSLAIYLAQTKLFRARWSNEVHDEWTSRLLKNRPDLKAEEIAIARALMNAAVPNCLAVGYEPLMAGLVLPDPDDRHVLAAAIKTRADVIVTFNLEDFPVLVLEPLGVFAQHPDEFLLDLLDLKPDMVIDAVRTDWRHYKNPLIALDDYIASLKKAGVPKFADRLRSVVSILSEGDV